MTASKKNTGSYLFRKIERMKNMKAFPKLQGTFLACIQKECIIEMNEQRLTTSARCRTNSVAVQCKASTRVASHSLSNCLISKIRKNHECIIYGFSIIKIISKTIIYKTKTHSYRIFSCHLFTSKGCISRQLMKS